MNRRSFILIGAGAAAIAVPSYYFFGKIEYNPSITIPKSLAVIWDEGNIRSVGRKYIQKSKEKSERSLVKGIMDGHNENQSINDFIDQKTSRDFQAGRTVIVDGWILAVTEARQCALYSITKL